MSALAFDLPPALEASSPPEARGPGRDAVRLMVARRGDGVIEHARFGDLPSLLAPGDVLVVNTSATLPAALHVRRDDGTALQLRVSTPAPDLPPAYQVVELRSADGSRPFGHARAGERLALPGGGAAELVVPQASSTRLWLARFDTDVAALLTRHGEPISYGYVPRRWPLAAYQTVFAAVPGSAEMPSAGRPFTPELVTHLATGGVLIAPLLLHTGVSSLEAREAPYPERYAVPETTAWLINAARARGGRVIALGTTSVRALETVAADDGTVAPGDGWTGLVITADRGLRAVDGLITGWHEPEASHLAMLEAIAGPELLDASYRAALERGYLWHEFGDSHLILPD